MTVRRGLGSAPFGAFPFGLYPPTGTSQRPGVLVGDDGAQGGSRAIDPRTGRILVDDDGTSRSMPDVDQLVVIALRTVRGASALGPDVGLARPPERIGTSFIREREDAIRRALGDLVRAGLVDIVSVVIDTSVRPVREEVQWRDLTRDRLRATEL